MGWFSSLFASEATKPIEAVGNVLDGLFTSDEERLDKQIIMERLAQQPSLAQIELNKIEAAHRSLFVAGWRPACGWVCAIALFYNFVIRDIMAWVITNSDSQISMPPELAMEHLMTVMLSLLGLGGLRTVEKMKGKAK